MADLGKLSFARLNNTNWQTWKFRMEMLLMREELWYVITQAVPAPVTAQWSKDEQKARATIGLCLEDSQFSLVKSATTAKQFWDNLRAYHEKSTMTSRVSLLKKLCSLNLCEGGDMEKHLLEIEELYDRLSTTGIDLEEPLRIAMILRSLPDSYGGLVTALEGRPDTDLTMQLVKSKLLDEFERRKEKNGGSRSEANAMKSSTKNGKQSGMAQNRKCFHCGKPGHFQRDCRVLARQKKGDEERKRPEEKQSAKQAKNTSGGVCFLAGSAPRGSWYIDSGASCHMTCDESFFSSLKKKNGPNVFLADGKVAKTAGCGEGTVLGVNSGGEAVDVKLVDVLYVPSLTSGLISVDKLTASGFTAVFKDDGCEIRNATGSLTVVGERFGCLYRLKLAESSKKVEGKTHTLNCQHQWHRRFGHRHPDVIRRIREEKLGIGMNVSDCGIRECCEPCLEGKLARQPIPKTAERKSTQVLDLIHTDLCGPMRTTTPGGKRFLMTMIDDFSRFTVVYLLEKKSEAPEKVMEYVRYAENLFNRKPRIVRSDGGGEYANKELRDFFVKEGIKAQFTTAYTPQQNGVAERKNRSLQEMATTMLLDGGLPKRYWGEAVVTAAYLQNRLPSRSVEKTPYERWYGRQPVLSHLKVYGCPAYVHIPDVKRGKFDSKARKLRFIGYSDVHKGYRFVDTATDKVTISRDARFLELEDGSFRETELESTSVGNPPDNQFEWPLPVVLSKQPAAEEELAEDGEESEESVSDKSEQEQYHSMNDPDPEEDPLAVKEEDETEEENSVMDEESSEETGSENRQGRRTRGVLPSRFKDYVVGVVKQKAEEPATFKQAVSSPDRELWKEAMDSEIQSHKQNGTWELVPLPKGKKVVGSRWVYKIKRNESNEVVRYKARIVAQGFTQCYGVDYDEVFAPVTKHATLRVLLSLAAKKEMVLRHIDVRTAYLYGDIEEELYMRQPPGYEVSGKEEIVCRLRRSIYGLKQSARCWNRKLTGVLTNIGFQASSADPCLFVATRNGKKVYLIVYVDDFLVGSVSEEELARVQKQLSQHFEIVDLGDVKHFLGLEVQKENDGYSVSLANYIDKLVARVGLSEAKMARTPMDQGYPKLEVESKPFEDGTKYRSVVGALLYVAVCARPDIATSVGILGRKFSAPTEADWTAAKRVVRYLKGTKDWKLQLGGKKKEALVAFSDSDWAGDQSTRKSTTGYVVFYGGGAVCWVSRRQSCVTLSTMEAEYVALAETCQEVVWLRRLLEDFGERQSEATVINEDNQGCLSFARSERSSKRSKHIETKHHFVRDLCDKGEVVLQYCPTDQMPADVLTKPLGFVKHQQFAEQLGLLGERPSRGKVSSH